MPLRDSCLGRQEAKPEAERRVPHAFDSNTSSTPNISNKNVERLRSCIEYEGCYRLESKYHGPAIIDQQLLSLAIRASNTSHASLLLESAYNVCQGRTDFEPAGSHCHRRIGDVWQISISMVNGSCPIALTYSYPPDYSEALRRFFQEVFSNERHPSDGYLCRQIPPLRSAREYQRRRSGVGASKPEQRTGSKEIARSIAGNTSGPWMPF